jgi:hypothetical protein
MIVQCVDAKTREGINLLKSPQHMLIAFTNSLGESYFPCFLFVFATLLRVLNINQPAGNP